MAVRSKVLAVDDNGTNIMLYEELLEESYELETAADGQEALEKVAAFKPDVVLLDIMMPGMSGYEVCTEIRQMPVIGPSIKVILVSARNTTEDRIIGYEAGADDYLIKPFDEDELEAKLKVFLKLKSMEEIDQLKSAVMSMFSNETRTPLNGILGPLQLLQSNNETNTPQERSNWLNLISKSAEDLQSLVEKVLLLSKLRSGQHKLRLQDEGSADLLQHLVYSVQQVSSARGIDVSVVEAPEAQLPVDRDLIMKCLMTLVDNALNFSKSGSSIALGGAQHGNEYRFSIADATHQVDPSVLESMWGEPANDERPEAQSLEGQSLSLSIAREVAAMHRGKITVASNDEEGTVFTLALPLAA
jgi:CheY-like chemotaxis protein